MALEKSAGPKAPFQSKFVVGHRVGWLCTVAMSMELKALAGSDEWMKPVGRDGGQSSGLGFEIWSLRFGVWALALDFWDLGLGF